MQRLTLYMTTDNYTWTENYWNGNAITAASAAAVASARAAMNGQGAFVVAVRITDTTRPKWAYYLPGGTWQGAGSFFSTIEAGLIGADRPYSVAIGQYTGVHNTISRIFHGGVPDDLIQESNAQGNVGGINPGIFSAWQGVWQNFITTLASFGFGWLRRVYANGQKCQKVLTNGPTSAPVGVQVAAPITIPGLTPPTITPNLLCKGFRSINTKVKNISGAYYISTDPSVYPPTAPNYIYYLVGSSVTTGNNIQQFGFVYPWADDIDTFQATFVGPNVAAFISKATHRKRGGKELAPAGRSKTRK
jgi:hypothetical protein